MWGAWSRGMIFASHPLIRTTVKGRGFNSHSVQFFALSKVFMDVLRVTQLIEVGTIFFCWWGDFSLQEYPLI